jgi:hypothetical protein
MSVYGPVVWVAFRDGKVEKRGPVRAFISRGRGRRAAIYALVQVKNRIVPVGLDDIQVVRAPRKR